MTRVETPHYSRLLSPIITAESPTKLVVCNLSWGKQIWEGDYQFSRSLKPLSQSPKLNTKIHNYSFPPSKTDVYQTLRTVTSWWGGSNMPGVTLSLAESISCFSSPQRNQWRGKIPPLNYQHAVSIPVYQRHYHPQGSQNPCEIKLRQLSKSAKLGDGPETLC